jgi:hypothetical protein
MSSGPSEVYPAFKPVPPKLFDYGGPVIATPKLVPVFFANDDAMLDAQFEDFIDKVGASPYWSATTAEYGVGPAAASASIKVTDTPSGTIDDTDIQNYLANKLNSEDPLFPKADSNTVFVIPYPAGVTITSQGATSCVVFGAYHTSVKLDENHGGIAVPYVVVPRCPTMGMSAIDTLTSDASHELVEASTDPFPETNPAYGRVDLPDYAWKLFLGGEACDMCAQQPSAFQKLPGLDYTVQRCWSNKSAAALHDPCGPSLPGLPYFNTAPLLPDQVTVKLFGYDVTLHSVQIPVGGTKQVELDLFSEAATSGPWKVSVKNVGPVIGGDGTASDLDLKLDRNEGQNGEKLSLSVHVLQSGMYGVEMFTVRSTLAGQDSLWVAAVTN